MQPDQGSAPDRQHAQPDVSLEWVEGQAEALPGQRPMYCSSHKRGIFFPVTFLKESGWNTSARSLRALSRTFLASSKDLWPNRQNGNFYLEKEGLTDFQVSWHMPKKPLWSTCSQWDLFGTKQSPAGHSSWGITCRAIQVNEAAMEGLILQLSHLWVKSRCSTIPKIFWYSNVQLTCTCHKMGQIKTSGSKIFSLSTHLVQDIFLQTYPTLNVLQ